jgi:hypothetical protein
VPEARRQRRTREVNMGVEFDDWDEIQEEIKREQQVEDEDDDD